MKLCSQSEGTLPSRMIAIARSRIMEAPMSPAALIISTTMPHLDTHVTIHVISTTMPHLGTHVTGRSYHLHQYASQIRYYFACGRLSSFNRNGMPPSLVSVTKTTLR